ncbi:CARDB domain-containing protein [Hymenobacter lucidus]|uniref:T9SS type A sorting domain-containing protein n=1 Tax=Hymenobacter lucidus TaxID=2880930 RepID=A0ABS8AUV0_9BACT|nr:CARDB domain-containing protein [Hymenobacter lucidus]MCB2409519.1 T9SS type A sorting domain-containing protein [Hymenobacter lucidus]
MIHRRLLVPGWLGRVTLLWLLAWLGAAFAARAQQPLDYAEYYLDTDPGYGRGTRVLFPAAAAAQDHTFTADFSAATPGIHTLYARVHAKGGRWSQTLVRSFLKSSTASGSGTPPNITQAEYYLDTDPGLGQATALPVTATRQLDQVYTLDLSALPAGVHTLNVRVRDANKHWSLTYSQSFLKMGNASGNGTAPNITRAEYYIDSNPGLGRGTALPVTSGASIDHTYSLDLSALTPGVHTINVRTMDANKHWSLTHTQSFLKMGSNSGSGTAPNITRAEYYLDTDPGYGRGTAISVTPGQSIDQVQTLDLSAVAGGVHTINVRVKDANGRWSLTHSQTFLKVTSDGSSSPAPLITKLQYQVMRGTTAVTAPETYVLPVATRANKVDVTFSPQLCLTEAGAYVLRVSAVDANGKPSLAYAHPFSITAPTKFQPNLPDTLQACSGQPVTLTSAAAGAGSTYRWNTGETTQSITVNTAGRYFVDVTSAGGCVGTDTTRVLFTPGPVVSLPDTTAATCGATSVTLDAGAGFGSYLWSTGATTRTITTATPGAYSVTVTGANSSSSSCSATAGTYVVIPRADIAQANQTVCTGTTVALSLNGPTNGTIRWSTGETTASISVKPTITTTYTATVKAGSYSCTDQVTISIAPPLPLNLPDTTAVACGASSATLDAGAGASSYLWSTGSTARSISVSTPGWYKVTVMGACQQKDSTYVVLPNADIVQNNQTVCSGTSVNLTLRTPINGTILWSTGETTASISVAPTMTTTYTVTVKVGSKVCTDQVTITVTPAPTVSLQPFAAVCANPGSVLLTGGSPVSGTYSGPGVSGGYFTPTTAGVGTHTITYSYNQNGCPASATQTITVNPLPVVTFAVPGPVCRETAAFALTGGAPTGGTYSGPGVTGGQFNPAAAGPGLHTLTYTYTNGSGCANTATQTIEVLPKPVFAASDSLVCAGQSVTLRVTGAGAGATYVWSTGATTSSITATPTVQTTYSVTVTNGAGCSYTFTQKVRINPYTATPGMVSQMQPVDNSNGLSLPISFSWAPATGAASYELFIWPAAGTQPTQATVPNINTLAYTYSGALPYGQPYKWRVVSVTPCGRTEGPVQTFRLRELPDIRVTNIVVPDTVYAGQTMELSWNITNSGAGSTLAQQWSDRVYISQDSTFSSAATVVGARGNTTFLQPNGTYITTATFPVPYSQAGRYYVFVKADDYGQLPETNETNNRRRAADRVLVIVPETPDFAVENFVSPPDNSVGNSMVQLRYRVYNRGTVASTVPRVDQYFISPDTIQNIAANTAQLALGPNALLLGSQTVTDTLLPGGYYQRTVNLRIPHTQYGTRYFYVYTDANNAVFETASTNNANAPVAVNIILRPPADLAPFRLSVPANTLAGTSMNITWDVRNTGLNVPVETYWADKFWLSKDATFNPATATEIGVYNVFNGDTLAPNHHYRRTIALNIPNGMSGQYYVYGKADFVQNKEGGNVFEYTYEGNNLIRSASPVTIGLTYADLAPAAFTGPSTVDAFETFTVNYTIRNTSNAVGNATGTWNDVVYLHQRNGGNAYCTTLGTVSHTGPLAPGQTYTGSMTLTIPRWVDPGEYDLVLKTDANGSVYEYDFETNNEQRVAFTYRYSDDLRVTALTTTGAAYSGQSVQVNWTVDNQGAFRTLATGWYDQVFLSKDNVLDASDLNLSTVQRNGELAVGGSYAAQATVKLPHGLQGSFYVIAKTGNRNGWSCGYTSSPVLVDTNLANNVRTVALPITLTPPADLVVQSVTFPTDVVAGQQVQIPFAIKNQGTGATLEGNWNDGIYVNTAPTVNGATRIGNYNRVGTLAGGASYSTLLNVTVPAYLSGNYYIFLVADNSQSNGYSPTTLWGGAVQYGTVYEHEQELNNIEQGSLLIRVPQPADLVVTAVAVPGNKKLGETMTVHYSVKNQGANPAVGLLKDGLFLSQDLVVDGAVDKLFASSTRNLTIQPNQTITGVVKNHVQAIEPGTYNGLMATNLFDDIYEGPANNNNVLAAGNSLNIGVDELALRTNTAFKLDLDSMVYYKVTPGADKDMLLKLTSNQPFGQNEVYVAHNRVPTPASYDFIYTDQVSPNQELLIPTTQAGPYYILVKTPYVYAGLQTATLYADTLGFQVRSITADRVGQGRVTTQVLGAGFRKGITRFYLTKGTSPTVVAEARVLKFRSSVELTLRWQLDSVAVGQYNVVAENGTKRVQLTNGLTVEPRRALSVDFATIIPKTIRAGTSGNWTYFLKNTSNVDVPYWEFQYNLPSGSNPVITHTPNVRKKSDFHAGAGSNTPNNRLEDGLTEVLPFVAQDLVPDEVIQVNIRLTPQRVGQYPVVWNQAAMTEEWYSRQTLDHISRYRQAVLAQPAQYPTGVVALATNQVAWQDSLQNYYSKAGLLDKSWIGRNARTGYTAKSETVSIPGGICGDYGITECPRSFRPDPFSAVGYPSALIGCADSIVFTYKGRGLSCTEVVGSSDPNLIVGPDGLGKRKMVGVQQTLNYQVQFENDPLIATAPAQVVRVQVPLSSAYEPRSFRVGSFGWGKFSFDVPANTSTYTRTLDMPDSLGYDVRVLGTIDVVNRRLLWQMETIDPATGLAPEDPNKGFLLINDSTGRGQGFVNYLISASANAFTGDTLASQASIVFDSNGAIKTNRWWNILDGAAPSSHVNTLAVRQASTSVQLSWTGGDDPNGSGLRSYALYVARDKGAFEQVEARLSGNSYTFVGEPGVRYDFFTLATDSTDNREAMKLVGDTYTVIDDALEVFDLVHNQCLVTDTIVSTGAGQWQRLYKDGKVVAAINDRGRALGKVAVQFSVMEGSPARSMNSMEVMDRNWHVVAQNPFVGGSVDVRFYGLKTEFDRLKAANDGDANDVQKLTDLRLTQYSGPNEDCVLSNNTLSGPATEVRLLTPTTTAVDTEPYFVAEVTVTDHFSEFYLNGPATPLPVQLTKFTATLQGKAVAVRWHTAQERNSHYFAVEATNDPQAGFREIGRVQGKGTTSSASSYEYLDTQLPAAGGLRYYRLRQVDVDGTTAYSPVATVMLEQAKLQVQAHPNPFRSSELEISIEAPKAGVAELRVVDLAGRTVLARTVKLTAGSTTVALPELAPLPTGMYLLTTKLGESVQQQKLVKE